MFRAVLFSSLILATTTTFATLPPKPLACPSASEIKRQGLPMMDNTNGFYLTYNISTYGLKEKWQFGIVDIFSENESDARRKAERSLFTLFGWPSPTNDGGPEWDCRYFMLGGFGLAYATTYEGE